MDWIKPSFWIRHLNTVLFRKVTNSVRTLTILNQKNWGHGAKCSEGFVMGILTPRWNDLNKLPSEKEIKRLITNDVENNWGYWRPIAYGRVALSGAEYDSASPMYISKLNSAMDKRVELEARAYEEAKNKARSEAELNTPKVNYK